MKIRALSPKARRASLFTFTSSSPASSDSFSFTSRRTIDRGSSSTSASGTGGARGATGGASTAALDPDGPATASAPSTPFFAIPLPISLSRQMVKPSRQMYKPRSPQFVTFPSTVTYSCVGLLGYKSPKVSQILCLYMDRPIRVKVNPVRGGR